MKPFITFFFFVGLACYLLACSDNNPAQSTIDVGESAQSSTTQVDHPQQSTDAMGSLQEESAQIDEVGLSSWKDHIASYSQGWVAAEQAIKIQFHHPVVDKGKQDKPFTGEVVVQPSIDFKVFFSDLNELVIQPENRLQSGQIYSVSIAPVGLKNITESLPAFQFQVQALQQDYELKVDGLAPESGAKTMTLTGQVQTTDTASAQHIESTLRITQLNQPLQITWHHDEDGLVHRYVVAGIERQSKATELTVSYNANIIGVEKRGKHPVPVPAIDQFSVTAVRAVQRPKQYVEVSFSEPLDRNQNLNGLIRLDGQPVSVRVDGSRIKIYPPNTLSGRVELEIDDTVHSSQNLALPETHQSQLTFVSKLPGVRFVSSGTILPSEKDLTVPFEAINVKSVWVTAFKVYGNNLQQFIQRQTLQSQYGDNSTGRYLWRKKITLPSIPFDQWQQYQIDLKELMTNHSDGLVHIQLSIDQSSVAFPCASTANLDVSASDMGDAFKNYDGPNMEEYIDRPSWFARYYSPANGYVTYEQRRDPCSAQYYQYYASENIRDARYFVVSDMGLIVKKGLGHSLHVVTTGLQSAEPKPQVELKLYNFQHQMIASALSDDQGMALLEPKTAGFYLIATKGQDRGFIRLPRNEALPTSQFDVAGVTVRKGLKGFLFGERDVWRPGDDIYLTFVLQDKDKTLPDRHPVSLDFFDPRGSKITTLVNAQPVGNLYTFTLKTDEKAPTGNWRAIARVGGEYFDKTVKVETITPNRLKIDVKPAQSPMLAYHSPVRTELFSQWLNGAIAKNLKADVEMKLSPTRTDFDGYGQFLFDDPASAFKGFSEKVFDQPLDDKGRAAFDIRFQPLKNAPGKLKATFITRVFEQSGNFSTSLSSSEVLPFQYWVGVQVPKGSGYQGAIARDQDHPVRLLSIDSEGKPQSSRKLSVHVYRIGWRWWWDQSKENLANYIRGKNIKAVAEAEIVTDGRGQGEWLLKKNAYRWGRHLVRVCDQLSGHCSGQEVYLGWSWSQQVNPDSATQLVLATDKKRYQPGDTAIVKFPALASGNVLYSIENGTRIIEQKWLQLNPGDSSFSLPITREMSPNVYLNVMVLQPHKKRASDAPIRLYGIVPIVVEDPESHITPIIDAPEQVRPESTFEVTVSEKNQRAMSYTLAVVDEGLLGITGYSTPNPHSHFYRRETLGVMTWDLFDNVIGAYSANLERLLKIGGGDKGKDKSGDKQRRFPPVVRFFGAFQLAAGEQQKHTVSLPQYMGAVRVMVVAADQSAYGKAEQSIRVTQPLTILATLPRVLGPGETVSLPVNVFVNQDSMRKVDVTVETDDFFEITTGEKNLLFREKGDQIAQLGLRVKNKIGRGKVVVRAHSGQETAQQTIYIESRSPNQPTTHSVRKVIAPGEIWQPELKPHGLLGSNQGVLTVSGFPAMNLQSRLDYLVGYPHGCLEQTTSRIFPQIWLKKLVNLTPQQEDDVAHHVMVAIEKFRTFQNTAGGFSYWPSSHYVNNWTSVYATHFLIEAKAMGYAVPQSMLDQAILYLNNLKETDRHYGKLLEAYRLYVLAQAGKPNMGAMNRLREALAQPAAYIDDITARWFLASIYSLVGLNDVARELMSLQFTDEPSENQTSTYRPYTFASRLSDSAMMLMAYNQLGDTSAAWQVAESVAKGLAQTTWHSTHTTAWSLLSLAKFADHMGNDGSTFSLSDGNQGQSPPQPQWQAMVFASPVFQYPLKSESNRGPFVRNDGDKPLHVELSYTGVPKPGEENSAHSGLQLTTRFTDMHGVPLDVSALPQGQDFIAEIRVSAGGTAGHFNIEDIATSAVMPSGWQIRNQRLEGSELTKGLDYQDIRDDRVLSYFSLWRGYHWSDRYNDETQDEQIIQVVLNASFAGRFYLPGWQASAMYDDDFHARTKGMWVKVIAEKELADDSLEKTVESEKKPNSVDVMEE